MVGQPNGVINHPAWSLGHLTVSADHLGTFLGLELGAGGGLGQTVRDRGDPIR